LQDNASGSSVPTLEDLDKTDFQSTPCPKFGRGDAPIDQEIARWKIALKSAVNGWRTGASARAIAGWAPVLFLRVGEAVKHLLECVRGDVDV
jgi:hypothetical protein